MTEGPRPRPGGSQRGPQPDPRRRPQPGVADLRDRLLSGHGSPEGSVLAGAGTQYQDVDPTGTGRQFKKTTPSGNTGWVEIGGGGGGITWVTIDAADYAAGASDPGFIAPAYGYDGDFVYLRGVVDIDAVGSAPLLFSGITLPSGVSVIDSGSLQQYAPVYVNSVYFPGGSQPGPPDPAGFIRVTESGGAVTVRVIRNTGWGYSDTAQSWPTRVWLDAAKFANLG